MCGHRDFVLKSSGLLSHGIFGQHSIMEKSQSDEGELLLEESSDG